MVGVHLEMTMEDAELDDTVVEVADDALDEADDALDVVDKELAGTMIAGTSPGLQYVRISNT